MKNSVTAEKGAARPQEKAAQSPKTRYRVLDVLRGLAVFNMIAYHTLWDLVYIFGLDLPWYRSKGAYIWQQSICWFFILLSGFCYPFGSTKGKAKRGTVVFLAGALVTLCTKIAMPQECVVFGVLTLLGSCMLLLLPAQRLFEKAQPALGLVLCLALFFLTRNINDGCLGFESLRFLYIPSKMYKNLATAFLGFPSPSFESSDYFSLFPWVFLFAAGCFLNLAFKKRGGLDFLRLKRLEGRKTGVLEWVGKNSLVIYLLHQPIIYAVCALVFRAVG